MRIKPAALGLILVVTLCGATQPADEPSQAAAPVAPEAAVAPAPEAAASDPQEAPPPAAEAALPLEAAFDAAVSASPSEAPVPGAATPSAEAAGPAKGTPPTKEYFAGVWAEQGKSCDTAIDFKADGTMIGPFPRWELSDQGELTMVGNRQKVTLTVIDQNTMQSRRAPKDPPRTLKRCVKEGA